LGIALQAVTLAVHQRLAHDVTRYAGSVDLRVVPPLCPISVSPTDFSQADDLIRRAQALTRSWLEHGHTEASVSALTVGHTPNPYRPANGAHDAQRAH